MVKYWLFSTPAVIAGSGVGKSRKTGCCNCPIDSFKFPKKCSQFHFFILLPYFPKMGVFGPTFRIFGRKFTDNKFSDNTKLFACHDATGDRNRQENVKSVTMIGMN